MAYLFQGTQEQSYVAHVMAYAACIGQYQNEDHCVQIDLSTVLSTSSDATTVNSLTSNQAAESSKSTDTTTVNSLTSSPTTESSESTETTTVDSSSPHQNKIRLYYFIPFLFIIYKALQRMHFYI
jgi:hypothetical protein